jgi:hypothetical protein
VPWMILSLSGQCIVEFVILLGPEVVGILEFWCDERKNEQ